jgi:hypothetical protein
MEDKNIVKDFLIGGWLIPAIGAAGMIARMFVQKTPYTIKEFVKNVASAAILSAIAWFVLHDAPFSDFVKAICYGVIGVISPEVINGIIALGKKFEKNPQKFIKK